VILLLFVALGIAAFVLALLLFTLAFAAIGIGAVTVLVLMFATAAFMRAIIRRQ
jgi:hypothetical protein